MDLSPTAAANRLAELVAKGLLLRQAQGGKVGDWFVYPWPQVTGPNYKGYDSHLALENSANGNRDAPSDLAARRAQEHPTSRTR
jgi:hypothetical protein